MRIIVLALILICSRMEGADINAASASQANVQTAVDAAVDGDRVVIPAGSATWSSGVDFDGKAITIKGNGIGSTIITDGTSFGVLNPTVTAGEFIRITDIEFIASGSHTSSGLLNPESASTGGATTGGFRIDHCKFTIGSAITRGILTEGLYGLIDNCFFNVTASSGSIQCISVFGSDEGSDGGYTPWTRALSLGTTNAVVIENCQFSYGNFTSFAEDCIDAYGGARLIVRYCGFLNDSIGFHGTDSGDRRSPVSFEIYNNTFTNNMSGEIRAGTIRGGTGVWYGNRYYGSGGGFNDVVQLYYRACTCLDHGGWDDCDGSNYKLNSANLSAQGSRECNTAGTVGFCTGDNETIGTFGNACSGGTYSRYFDGSGTGGFPGRDQPGIKPGQVIEAIYCWDNDSHLLGTYDGGCPNGFGLANYLVPGQTYTNASAAKSGYTELTYPHPLISGGGSGPSAPSSLSASAVSSSQINLSWTDNASDESGFEVDRALDAAFSSSLLTTGGIAANATSYNSTGLSPVTTYYYRVRATNAVGASTYSAEAHSTTTADPSGPGNTGLKVRGVRNKR